MMRKVSFKGLRFSLNRRRTEGDKSPSSNNHSHCCDGSNCNCGDRQDDSQGNSPNCVDHHQRQSHTELSSRSPATVTVNELNYVTPGEIQIPQRRQKFGIFGTIRRKLRITLFKRHENTVENLNIQNYRHDRLNKKSKTKKKPKFKFKPGGNSAHMSAPAVKKSVPSDVRIRNIMEESSSDASLSQARPSGSGQHFSCNELHIASDNNRETHSSCSSESCEHDNSAAMQRCSKVSVHVHCDEVTRKSGRTSHHGNKSSPSSLTLRKVNYSSPGELVLSGVQTSSISPRLASFQSTVSDLEARDIQLTAPVIPPRPDSTNNRIGHCMSFSQFHMVSFRTDSLLRMERFDASLHSPIGDEPQDVPKIWSLTKELLKLSKFGWYWGPLTRVEAEEKLSLQPNGAFLVRDSSDDRYLLSLSFRSNERTLHTRIEHCNGMFSFYAQPELEGYTSIVALIEHSMNDSLSGVFCYSRARTAGEPSFPVRLTKPVSRFTQVRSLQYLCRFVIRQYTRLDHIDKLPLPNKIKGWLEENQY